jgi:hypothetical protein
MAMWETKITVLDVAAKRVRVDAVRTDGEDVQTCSAEGTVDPGDLAGSKQRIVDAIWDAYQARKAKVDAAADMMAGWEAALAISLVKKEPK